MFFKAEKNFHKYKIKNVIRRDPRIEPSHLDLNIHVHYLFMSILYYVSITQISTFCYQYSVGPSKYVKILKAVFSSIRATTQSAWLASGQS